MQIWDVLVVVVVTNYEHEPGLRKLNRNESRKLARYLFAIKLLQFLIKQKISHHIFSQSELNEKLPVKRILPRIVTTAFMNLAL